MWPPTSCSRRRVATCATCGSTAVSWCAAVSRSRSTWDGCAPTPKPPPKSSSTAAPSSSSASGLQAQADLAVTLEHRLLAGGGEMSVLDDHPAGDHRVLGGHWTAP